MSWGRLGPEAVFASLLQSAGREKFRLDRMAGKEDSHDAGPVEVENLGVDRKNRLQSVWENLFDVQR